MDVSHKPATVCVHFSKIATLPNSSAPLVDLERKKKKKKILTQTKLQTLGLLGDLESPTRACEQILLAARHKS